VLVGAHKNSVESLSMLAYDEASNVRYGPAAAYATLLFLYVAVVAYLFVKILGADVIGEARAKKPGGGRRKKNGNSGTAAARAAVAAGAGPGTGGNV